MTACDRLFRARFGAVAAFSAVLLPAFALAALALLAGAGEAKAAQGPVDPEEIAQADRIDEARPYVSPTGEQIVIWKVEGGPERPLAARARSGASFGPVEELSRHTHTALPEVAFGSSGDAYAVWPIRIGGALGASSIRPAGGPFGAQQEAGVCHNNMSVAASPRGRLALACNKYSGGGPAFYGGVYGVADELRAVAPNVYAFASTNDPHVRTEVAWGADESLLVATEYDTAVPGTEVRAVVRNPAGTATAALPIATAVGPSWLSLIGGVVFPNGTAAVAVSSGGAATADPARLFLRPAGGSFSPVAVPGHEATGLALDGAGNLRMAIATNAGMGDASYSVSVTSSGVLSAPVSIPVPPGAYLRDFLVAPDGTEFAVFHDATSEQIHIAGHPAGAAAFEPVQEIADGGARWPSAALTPTGDVLISWTRKAGPDDDRVVVGGLDSGARPVLAVEWPPARVLAGVPVRFAASANDSMGIRSLTWKFSDGGTASGEVVSHTFQAVGKYVVEATATDRAGNSTSESHAIEVVGATQADRRPARLRVKGKKKVKFKVLRRKGARYQVRSNERVRLVAQLIARPRSARISAAGDLVLAERSLNLNSGRRVAKLKPRARLLGKKPRNLRLRVRFVATDMGGNMTVVTRPLRVRR